jgi:hypothetical protein
VSTSVTKCSWVKCSKRLNTRASNRRYTDHMKFDAFFVYHILSRSFGSIIFNLYGCTFFMLLFNFVKYIFLLLFLNILFCVYALLCLFCSIYSVFILLFYVLFVCKCVLYYCHRV